MGMQDSRSTASNNGQAEGVMGLETPYIDQVV